MSKQYEYCKYVRKDNTPEKAKELGYLDARELFPDVQPRCFKEFVGDLLGGKDGKTLFERDEYVDSVGCRWAKRVGLH